MKITLAHPFAIHFTGLYVAAYDVLYTPRYIHGIVSRLTRVCCCGCSVSEVAWLQFHHQTVAVAALMNSVHVVVICVTFSLQVILWSCHYFATAAVENINPFKKRDATPYNTYVLQRCLLQLCACDVWSLSLWPNLHWIQHRVPFHAWPSSVIIGLSSMTVTRPSVGTCCRTAWRGVISFGRNRAIYKDI